MNDLGVLFVGGVVRVTAFAAIGTFLAILLRRRGPAVGTLLKMTTLSGLVALSVLSIGQGPTFWRLDAVLPKSEAPPILSHEPRAFESGQTQVPSESWLATFAREFTAEWKTAQPLLESQKQAVSVETSQWRWPAWLALAMLTAWSLAALRLALALAAVRRLCRRSEPIIDVELRDEIDILRAELSVARPIEPRECLELTTPATVGWRNPVILLPENWREWTPIERKAVLAHEIAHVQRGDYLSGLWAQVCLALHAYHPLAHWLVSQLRLDQELAADAAGAALTGGNRLYLESLARLALRQSEPPAAWPVRPFLPTRGTFLRRIEMLRDPKAFQIKPLGATHRAIAVVLLGAVAIALAGLRGPGQASADEKSPKKDAPELAQAPKPEQDGELAAQREQSMNNMKQIGVAMHNYSAANDHFPAASITAPGSKFPHSWRVALLPYLAANDLYKEYDFNEPWDSPKNLKLIPKMPAVLGHPTTDPTLGKTAYFVFHGPDTMFPPDSKGMQLQNIPDGTSNTILVIGCQRDIPWTKPEDIDYDPKNFPGAAVPEIKPFDETGFDTLFADGSVKYINKSIAPAVLKALISRAGGEDIDNVKF